MGCLHLQDTRICCHAVRYTSVSAAHLKTARARSGWEVGAGAGRGGAEGDLGAGDGEAGVPQHGCESGQAAEAVDGLHVHLEPPREAPLDGRLQHRRQLPRALRIPGEPEPGPHIVLLAGDAVAGLDGRVVDIIVQVRQGAHLHHDILVNDTLQVHRERLQAQAQ